MKKLNDEELLKEISKDEMTPFNKLGNSYVAIRFLVDFMQVLEKNEKDYEDPLTIEVCKKVENCHPSDKLSHYIILEAFNFYETLKYLKKDYNSLPNIPSYFKKLAKVRNKIIGHKDTKEELPLAENVINLIMELTEEANTNKMVADIREKFDLIRKEIEKNNKSIL